MPTLTELQARVEKADALLAKNLSPEDRLKVAKIRALDQVGIILRQKHPELDQPPNNAA
jgi:hypothetical protein